MFSLNMYLTAYFNNKMLILFLLRVLFNIARLYAKPATLDTLSIRLHESRLFNNRLNISNLRNTRFKEKLVTAHHVEELNLLQFQSPRTSSRSRDREVALTVPYVHSNRTLFLAKKPQVSWPWCICVRMCAFHGVYARVCRHADTRINAFKAVSY